MNNLFTKKVLRHQRGEVETGAPGKNDTGVIYILPKVPRESARLSDVTQGQEPMMPKYLLTRPIGTSLMVSGEQRRDFHHLL